MLVTIIFLLFPQCFLPNQRQKSYLSKSYFVICNTFNLDESKILSFSLGFTYLKAEVMFELLQYKFNPFPNKPWFLHVCSISVENTVEKREIAHNEQFLFFSQCFQQMWRRLPAFSPFPSMFSKPFFSRGVKSSDCMVMG